MGSNQSKSDEKKDIINVGQAGTVDIIGNSTVAGLTTTEIILAICLTVALGIILFCGCHVVYLNRQSLVVGRDNAWLRVVRV